MANSKDGIAAKKTQKERRTADERGFTQMGMGRENMIGERPGLSISASSIQASLERVERVTGEK
jgi:hypothetical protein